MGEGMRPVIVSFGEVLWDRMPEGVHLGGAPLNMVAHAVRCGAVGYLVSAVGDDVLGRQVLKALRRLGVRDEFVTVDPKLGTGVVDVSLKDGEPVYVIAEPVAWDRIPLPADLLDVVGSAQVLAVNTLSARSEHNLKVVRQLLKIPGPLKAMDVNLRPPFVDVELARELASMCDFVKANRAEACRLAGVPEGATDEAALAGLQEWAECDMACLTLGERGALLRVGEQVYSGRGPEVKVVDTVGAGDAFLGSLLTDLGRQRVSETVDLKEALVRACNLGAWVAGRAGAGVENGGTGDGGMGEARKKRRIGKAK